VDLLKSKVVPPGGSSFGPFIVANVLKRLFQAEADLTSNSCDWNLEQRRPFLRTCFFLRCEDQKKDLLCQTCTWFVSWFQVAVGIGLP